MKIFPVGSSPVESFPVKSLSKGDQNGKLSTDKIQKSTAL
jgi:hypothetical protein